MLEEEEIEDLRNIEREYLEFMKNAANSGVKITNNVKQVNMYFVIQTYKKAKNYKDIMDPPLTADEKNYVLENGGVYGGAIDLALACDFRIGVSGCQLLMPAASIEGP